LLYYSKCDWTGKLPPQRDSGSAATWHIVISIRTPSLSREPSRQRTSGALLLFDLNFASPANMAVIERVFVLREGLAGLCM
jgi:hypothetical protein